MVTHDDMLEIGRVNKVHGLRGEVVVTLSSNVTERVAPGSELIADDRRLVVAASRPHQGKWLVRFEGMERREDAEALGRPVLFGEPLDDPDALWVHEMLGAPVVDASGIERGTVAEVHDNPAADLLLLSSGAIVPLNFVERFDDGVIHVDVPDGLFELYDE